MRKDFRLSQQILELGGGRSFLGNSFRTAGGGAEEFHALVARRLQLQGFLLLELVFARDLRGALGRFARRRGDCGGGFLDRTRRLLVVVVLFFVVSVEIHPFHLHVRGRTVVGGGVVFGRGCCRHGNRRRDTRSCTLLVHLLSIPWMLVGSGC
jgi:hypothetical protein